MPIAWKDVAAKPEFQALSPDDQAAAQREYFESVVAPKLKAVEVQGAWNEFVTKYPVRRSPALSTLGQEGAPEALPALAPSLTPENVRSTTGALLAAGATMAAGPIAGRLAGPAAGAFTRLLFRAPLAGGIYAGTNAVYDEATGQEAPPSPLLEPEERGRGFLETLGPEGKSALQKPVTDFALGAGMEIGAPMVAWPVKAVVSGAGYLGRAILRAKAGYLTEQAVEGGVQAASAAPKEAGRKLFQWARSKMDPDEIIPAGRTVEAMKELAADRGKGKEILELNALAPKKGLRVRVLDAWKGGGNPTVDDAFVVYPKGQHPAGTVPPAGPGWEAQYLVYDDGGGVLFWYNPKLDMYRTPLKGEQVKFTDFIGAKDAISYINKSRPHANAVAVIPASPTANGLYPKRTHAFDVQRKEGIRFGTLMDLYSKTRSYGSYSGLSDETIQAAEGLRNAIEQDMFEISPAFRRRLQAAMLGYRLSKDPLGAAGKAMAFPVNLGARLGTAQVWEDQAGD